MKDGIHPKTNQDVTVNCACGNTFVTISTLDKITVEICSACHPFYTGQQKFVDTEGRIDKFEKKRKIAQMKKLKAEAVKKAKVAKKSPSKKAGTGQPSLKDMLDQARKQTS